MNRSAALWGSVLGLMLAIAGWREYSHRQATLQHSASQTMLEARLQSRTGEWQEAVASLAQAEKKLAEQDIDLQSLRDRTTNLEAQRNHLQAYSERQQNQLLSLEETISSMSSELDEARFEMMQISAQPRQLESQLIVARNRIESLEEQMDLLTSQSSKGPLLMSFAGKSSDFTVFALEGDWQSGADLPTAVQVCHRNEIILEGWIHRFEESQAIGHVAKWIRPPSALVKGEKVFILPVNHHDPDS